MKRLKGGRTCVYLAHLPETECDLPLFPEERDRAVRAVTNPLLRREKYYVWRLLELAVRASLGAELTEIGLRQEGEGWTSEAADISLSHGGGALAVALSDSPVGIDIEPLSGEGDGRRLADRFFSDGERERYLAAPENERREAFLRIWTAKEAVFKSRRESVFAPSAVDSSGERLYTACVRLGDGDYILSVASEGEVTLHTVEL